MRIEVDDLTRPQVHALLTEHLRDMHATSPPESIHALDLDGLRHPDITFWTAWLATDLAGCVALKRLDATHAELKSMRTAAGQTGRGIGTGLLTHALAAATAGGYRRVSLETGSMAYFEPARRLYRKHGFRPCQPFGDYRHDPHSMFFTKIL